MRFAKYHGLGNDFLVVDLRGASAAGAAAVQAPEAVIALCDRQFGVGGEGVLAVLPSASAGARMRVLNGCGSAHSVTVAMGKPRLLRGEIPMSGPAAERCVEQPLEVAGASSAITCVSMGNPHAIAFVGSRDEAYRLATTVGTLVENHACFPRRTNAEFACVKSRDEIDLIVWERGCGITLACGTGACATAVAAVVTGRADEGRPIRVNLLGGSLEITVQPGLSGVAMKGPAIHVFD